jgi:hypothetical protein
VIAPARQFRAARARTDFSGGGRAAFPRTTPEDDDVSRKRMVCSESGGTREGDRGEEQAKPSPR